MSNKLHETEQTSPQNQQDDEEGVNNNAIGVSESTMKMIVIVLGVLLLLGFAVVVVTIVYRIVNLPSDEQTVEEHSNSYELIQTQGSVAYGNIEVAKPKDSSLKSFEVDDGMIYFYFESTAGTQSLKIVRLSDGMVVGGVNFVDGQE